MLFTFAGGSGHADPLLPVAHAAHAAGHAVAFAGRASVTDTLQPRGFRVFGEPVGTDEAPAVITPLLELSPEREDRVLRDYYAGRAARARAASVLALCSQWSPAVVVCDEVDFGSMIAAERVGIPHTTVLVTAAGSFVRPEVVGEPLNVLRAEHGLPPDPGLAMPTRHLVLSPFPPSFRDPAFPLPATAYSIRPPTLGATGADAGPGWLSTLTEAPTVYVTLGTVFNLESGDLFGRLLSGLRELPINLIVTVGRQIDPAAFGPQPAHVHIEPYIPHPVVLPHCDLVVSHGGSGTVIAALAAGLPSVVLPMGADQPLNAARCEALGVGVTLDVIRATPKDIRAAAVVMLGDSSYRAAAERIQAEIATLPAAAEAVPLIERLASARSRLRPP